ncbi:hypothetical protein I6I78_17160 (plasmid) [Enterococcus casseliflavus]|uniref:LMxysn_1693 family intestinal colonization protein n=1 Tax=Enterococcus casseliflavus TaxID=37734 RepID=UPI00191B3E7A|nr:hypothetical protein [Enterococcus casseliflavus]QQU21506.1 hypothetical protein I6I78_17160 [Enterococcus casseliflavus]
MKKRLVTVFLMVLGLFSLSLISNEVNASEINFDSISSSENFVDPELVGTSIDVDHSLIQPRSGGYLYKNGKITSYKVTKRTYAGIVNKNTKTWIKFSVSGKILGVTLTAEAGKEYSEKRQAKRYNIVATAKATFGVYDKYSGNYMYSTTVSGDLSGREDIAI